MVFWAARKNGMRKTCCVYRREVPKVLAGLSNSCVIQLRVRSHTVVFEGHFCITFMPLFGELCSNVVRP